MSDVADVPALARTFRIPGMTWVPIGYRHLCAAAM
jgi:hypothetical protein